MHSAMRALLVAVVIAASCSLLCSGAGADATPATPASSASAPLQPPSYAIHANPHTTRPPNTPPLVPQPPSFEHVAPTSGGVVADDGEDVEEPEASVPLAPPQADVRDALNDTRIAEEGRGEDKKREKKIAAPPAAAPVTTPAAAPTNASAPASASASAAKSPSGSSSAAVGGGVDSDPDRIIEDDDPHSLPIPGGGGSGGGGAGAGGGLFPVPHDPLIHVTPPPTGGWRAGQLRQREEEEAARKAKAAAAAAADAATSSATGTAAPADASAGSNSYGTAAPADASAGSNSYISPHGPSAAFRRNSSEWFDPPKLHGPVPEVLDPASYKPSGAPEYWVPTSAHLASLIEQHEALQAKHVARRRGLGARTTRLASLDPKHRVVEIRDNMLYVEGAPFWIQGICYSPVPIGESVSFTPKGDYFTPDYAYIWLRDLPLIKAMGATTLRIYGWAAQADHTMFLDAVQAAGLKVLVTYYLGDATQHPVETQDQRNQIIIDFVAQVNRYRDHPAILMWSFGNELNGAWNGFAKQFSDAFGCWWQAGCAGYSDTNSDCHWQSSCMYYQLFSWINAACRAAKMVTTRPIISGFADVDYMVGPTPWLDKVARFNYLLGDMDAWAVQLYRGFTFGGYFSMYRGESWKPMIVTEFGVDAYNDACGWPENNQGGCFNMAGEAQGGAADNGHFWGCAEGGECAKPGVQSQAEWDVRLAQELMAQYVTNGGIVWGGFLMAWTDEFWKGGGTQDLCAYPCKTWDEGYCRGAGIQLYKPGGGAMCSWKAHFTCPNFDTNYHDLCGYWLAAAPDNYVNEEWFGITTPAPCGLHKVNPDGVDGGYRLDTLYVRPAFVAMQQLWSGNSETDTSSTSCDALRPCWACAVTHNIDELNDGACELECEIKKLAVGPGSSVQAARAREEGTSWTRGEAHPDSFLQKFGIPLAVAGFILGVATTLSAMLWKQHSKKRDEAGEPLLRQ